MAHLYNKSPKWVCLSVSHTDISETVWPRVMKFCVRNLHSLWMISIEKNFGKIKKKKFEIFPDFFFIAKGCEPEGDRREPKGEFNFKTVFKNQNLTVLSLKSTWLLRTFSLVCLQIERARGPWRAHKWKLIGQMATLLNWVSTFHLIRIKVSNWKLELYLSVAGFSSN